MRVPERFNGPPGSGNGGYTCGLVAGALGTHAAEVSLRSPPPLEHELTVSHDGDRVIVHDGDTLVAEGTALARALPAPDPLDLDAARAATRAGHESWTRAHPFPTCFVCGPDRRAGDGQRIFPVELGDGRFVAEWAPESDVPPEEVWAALDCPTSAPAMNVDKDPPVVLARLAASLERPVTPGEYVLVSWELDRDGRKRGSACALIGGQGEILARSQALWIELK